MFRGMHTQRARKCVIVTCMGTCMSRGMVPVDIWLGGKKNKKNLGKWAGIDHG